MARETTCPSCHSVLRVPESVRDAALTCPRCLASVANPNLGVQTQPPGPAGEAEAGDLVSCWCGAEVEKRWRICPFCGESLRGRPARLRLPPAEEEVRRDSKGTAAGLGVLAAFAALGLLVLSTVGADFAAKTGGSTQVVATGTGVLVVIALGCAALTLATRNRPDKMIPVALGTWGMGITVTVVLAVLVLSCVLNFIFTCGGLLR